MHIAHPISIETFHEAQIITAEIWQSASSADIMLTMLLRSRLFQNSNHHTPQLYLFAGSCARRVNHFLKIQEVVKRFALPNCSLATQQRAKSYSILIYLLTTHP